MTAPTATFDIGQWTFGGAINCADGPNINNCNLGIACVACDASCDIYPGMPACPSDWAGPPPPPVGDGGYVPAAVSAIYQYTSFEEPAGPACPAACDTAQGGGGCAQDDCASLALAAIAESCTEGACEIPSLGGIWNDETGAAGFTTAYTSAGTELGFTSYWQACGDVTILTEAGFPACGYSQDAKDMIGVISNGPDGNTAWGAAGENQHLGDRGESTAHSCNPYG